VDQKGSIVQPERLRFDFSHNGSIDTPALAKIESICREHVGKALKVYSKEVALADARRINGGGNPSALPAQWFLDQLRECDIETLWHTLLRTLGPANLLMFESYLIRPVI
jgi:hypothetical protein